MWCCRQTEKDLAGALDMIAEFDKRKDAEEKEEMLAAKEKNAELVEKKRAGAEVSCCLLYCSCTNWSGRCRCRGPLPVP